MKHLALALALGSIFAMPLAASAQIYPHDGPLGGAPGYGYGDGRRGAIGRIVSVQGSSFTLDSGRTVFLKHGTVINPTGARLRAGQVVRISGYSAGDHNINAGVVDIMPRGGY